MIQEIVVEADTTGYVEPTPDEDEQELLYETWSILGNGDQHQISKMILYFALSQTFGQWLGKVNCKKVSNTLSRVVVSIS